MEVLGAGSSHMTYACSSRAPHCCGPMTFSQQRVVQLKRQNVNGPTQQNPETHNTNLN